MVYFFIIEAVIIEMGANAPNALAEIKDYARRNVRIFQHKAYLSINMGTNWSSFHRTVAFAGALTGVIQDSVKNTFSKRVLRRISVTAVHDRIILKRKKSLKMLRSGDEEDDDDEEKDLPTTRRGKKQS